MNILIVGNGFDLSHYLPTKYDHFMDVMGSIEQKDVGGLPKDLDNGEISEWLNLLNHTFEKRGVQNDPLYDMTFDDLFSNIRETNFIEKTKEYYQTQKVIIDSKRVIEIHYRLAKNCWYQYFKDHVKEVKTWIDFEQKIEEVLIITAHCLNEIKRIEDNAKIYEYFERCDERVDSFVKNNDEIRISPKNLKVLSFFKFCSNEEYSHVVINSFASYKIQRNYAERLNLNPEYCLGKKIHHGFNPALFLDHIYKQLEEFIEIFNLYLELVIDKLEPKSQFKIEADSRSQPDHIFSFNYTNTFRKFYQSETKAEFLHGHLGEEQNIVLGISDLQDESLKNLKAYGFTKYHQKLFKNTDYLFLDESTELVKKVNRGVSPIDPVIEYYKFYIWGHSLDQSDQEYIKEIFKLNDAKDNRVRVIVYYFDHSAKFSLLNNLLAILEKNKVEQWMKNKWLTFEPNPKIDFGTQEISTIQ